MENFNSPLIGQLSQSNPALAGFFVSPHLFLHSTDEKDIINTPSFFSNAINILW